MRSLSLTLATGLCLASASPSASAAQAYDNCTGTILTLPAVITTQGTWCLKADLATSMPTGTAITIAANNVTIDCNGFKLGGLLAGPGTLTTGIGATARMNATVRRCAIRGFARGVQLDGYGHLVEDSRFDGNKLYGIQVTGGDNVIRRNRVIDTGGGPVPDNIFGISAAGSTDIIDNSVFGVASVDDLELSIGIRLAGATSGTLTGNRVHFLEDQQNTRGIEGDGTGPVTIQGNDVIGGGRGIGILCGALHILASRNITVGFSDNMANCVDAGENDQGT